MLAVLLLGIAHQYRDLIKWFDGRSELKDAIMLDAQRFVQSEEFNLMCQSISIKPARLRELTPDQAMKLFELITSDDQKERSNGFD